jgi:hypothetical protein
VLQGQTSLTDELVQRIAARLEDEASYVRRAAVEVFKGQTSLTDKLLQRIAARLEDEDSYVRRAAVGVLVSQEALPFDSLSTYVKPLFLALLKKSSTEHVYWYVSDKSFIGVGSRHVSLDCKKEGQFSNQMLDLQNYLGVPPLCT